MASQTNWHSARKLAVYASWRPEGINTDSMQWAYELGELIGARKNILVTGGSAGMVLSCRRGCRDAGGVNLAVLPDAVMSDDLKQKSVIDIAIPTGLGVLGRMPVLAETADYAIAIGGGAGTLIEVALTYLQRKVVLVVENLRRRGDPAISRILSRRSRTLFTGVPAIRGYLDSKPDTLVLPIHVVTTAVQPATALAIADELYEHIGTQPIAAAEPERE